MEFIKVIATKCTESGEKISPKSTTELYINPDTVKAITLNKSIILKPDPNCEDDETMTIGHNHYNSFEFIEVISLMDLN